MKETPKRDAAKPGTIEAFVSRLVPFTLVLLLLIIIGELFYSDAIEPYSGWVDILDAIVVAVFIADLYFKYQRVRNVGQFVREYWLDLIAVFPFYYLFRSVEEALLFTTSLREVQGIMHETLGIGGYVGRFLSEVEKFARFGRSEELLRLLRPAARAPSFTKSIHLDFWKKKKRRK